ncbi:MAG: hypothetical protein Q4A65_05315 [Bacillota bacterium]|nr:hypothetical protein [Bacillota bacterium]
MKAKKTKNLLITSLLTLMMIFMGTAAQSGPLHTDTSFAETEYTIFVYSGKEGYFGSPGNTVKKLTGKKYGQKVTVSLGDLGLVVKHPEEYYVRGMKIAGHDNDELSSMQLMSYSFDIEEDTSFSIAYGIKGGMVKYRVKYQDRKGNTLHETEEFYGMPGDRPVVAFKLIDGYIPDDYNLVRELKEDESKNVFVFKYHKDKADSSGGGDDGDDSDNDGNGGNGGINTADNDNIPVNNIRDLDDNDTPLTINDEEKPGADASSGLASGIIYGIIGLGLLIALLLLWLLLRRKKKEDES